MNSAENLTQADVTVDGPLWNAAVRLKQARAYRQLDRDGVPPSFYKPQYDGFAQKTGRLLHDQKLREQAADCRIVGWLRGDELIAYAALYTAHFLGRDDSIVLNVVDLCISLQITPQDSRSLFEALDQIAREQGAENWEVTASGEAAVDFWQACAAFGGECVSKTFRFPCRRLQPVNDDAR